MVEEHWAYMDRFAATMIARGPTFASDSTLTGSVHILDLPDPAAARTFAFEEPGYQAGAYRDVLLRRWHNSLGRTMWDSPVVTTRKAATSSSGSRNPPPRTPWHRRSATS